MTDRKVPPPQAPPQEAKEDWDDLLGEAKQSGITPEMARALLSMNPKMREDGKNTQWVIASGQKAAHQGARIQQQTAPSKAAPVGDAGDVLTKLDQLQRKLEADDKQIEAQLKQLQLARTQAKTDTLDAFMRILLGKDPEMLSPLTQQALADKRAFLEKIGFSVKAFVEFKRKMGAK